MSSRGAEPHDHEPARQPTLAAYAPEPVLPPAASAPDWRSRQGRWVDRSLSGRHHLPCCRGLFRPVAKSNPCTIPRSKRQRPSYRSRPHTPNLWTVPVTVTMDDGKTLDAKVIGTDEKTDLALLKISETGDYPFVKLSKDMPRVGDWVVAIGNPFGLGGTVTAGIVSAEGRDIGSGPYDSFLQIDAPINKGNSGGPTFNLKGEVVGVNTAIFSPSGGSVGIGFAIPANTVDNVVDSLEHGGVVNRGYLGVQIQPVSQDIADGLGLKTANGALVDEAMPETPAAKAGLKSGDVITKLNGEEVKDASDLTRHIGALKPGEKVELTYLRDGAEKTANITLGSLKSEQTAKADDAATTDSALKLGVQLAPANDGQHGVAIVNVDPDGLAASKGLASGDVIMEVAGKPVSTPSEVKAGIAKAKQDGKKSVLMLVKTADSSRFVAFEFPKA